MVTGTIESSKIGGKVKAWLANADKNLKDSGVHKAKS
jgi:hypothetical protein